MDSPMKKRQPRKQKPKRKISELDEAAATRRRTQTCLAQRAFRQRNKDTIASLNVQVASLQKTIKNLNTCFIHFTDDLVGSGCLDNEPTVTKSLQSTIEHFITIIRTSHVHDEHHNHKTQAMEESGEGFYYIPDTQRIIFERKP